MIKEALYHRIDSEFSYFTSDGSVTLRLRAAKDDKISVCFYSFIFCKSA